jgi:hypothetical protein
LTDEQGVEDDQEQPTGRHLEWGETPFTGMSYEDLLLHAHRMLIALGSLYSIVDMSKSMEIRIRGEASEFWGLRGRGGAALEKADQIFALLNEGIDEEQHEPMHSSIFYRYAPDLLFDTTQYEMIGSGWRVCDACKSMWGSKHTLGQPCTFCKAPTRPLAWSDLAPIPKEGTTDA